MPKFDGTEKLAPTPFDAHEQATRGPHTHSAKDGYQATPNFKASEYPKVMRQVSEDEDGNEVITETTVKDADAEAKLKNGKTRIVKGV
jgi:hypothetical protein